MQSKLKVKLYQVKGGPMARYSEENLTPYANVLRCSPSYIVPKDEANPSTWTENLGLSLNKVALRGENLH